MAEPLAEYMEDIMSLGSPGDCRSTGACGEWKASCPGLASADAWEDMVRHPHGCSERSLVLIEP